MNDVGCFMYVFHLLVIFFLIHFWRFQLSSGFKTEIRIWITLFSLSVAYFQSIHHWSIWCNNFFFFFFLVSFISIFFSRSLTFYFILFSCSLNSNSYMCCAVSRCGIYVWNRLRCHSLNLLSIQSMNLHFYFDNNSNGMLRYLCVCSLERYSNPKNKIKFWISVIRNHVDDLIVKSGRIENKNEKFQENVRLEFVF